MANWTNNLNENSTSWLLDSNPWTKYRTLINLLEYSKFAFEPIKYHKESGRTLYYFGRSKKFWTFKYPYVWYNALYMADVLTRFKFLKQYYTE